MQSNTRDPPSSAATRPKFADETWLFVLPWDLSEPGGVNHVVGNLFDANTRVLGNRSLLLVNSWKVARRGVFKEDGRRTCYELCRNPWDPSRPVRNGAAFLAGLPATLARLRHLVRSENVSRVNVHYPDLDAVIWVALRALLTRKLRLILSFHGADLTRAMQSRGVTRRLWSRLLGSADEIIFCSRQLRLEFEQTFGAMPHLRVIDNGVDPDNLFSKATAEPMIELPSKYILSLATFENKKGHDILFRAFDLLAARDAEVQLVVAGGITNADVFEAIETHRKQLVHGGRVRLLKNLGHQAAMQLMLQARTFVLASREEPFGIVVLEAGALARPVVATSACGVTRRLTNGIDLLVVPPENAEAVADAIQRILDDDALALRLGTALRGRVHSEFTWERIIRDYAAIGAAP